MRRLLCCLLSLAACAWTQNKPATFADKIAGLSRQDGFIPYYWDARAGKILLELTRFDQELLYLESLPAGLGSNDVGLDRGQAGPARIVKFQRIGPKVLLIQPNYQYRAVSDDPVERRAVAESFASSVLFGFTVEAEEGGRVLVDATNFFLRDVHQVSQQLQQARQGNFRLDATRSAFFLERTKNFPRNTEVEVLLTFAGEQPGRFVREVTPSPDSITVREHHSFVQLPDNNYQPRAFNPNSGSFGIEYMDYATPISERINKRYIVRHRLRKKDPSAAVSEPVQPIRYYVDRGAPEPIRSALVEGARWWNQAFEAAGYRNAFLVEVLPEDADPMDVRYNVIDWVHRSTRGWSYGNAISDPRTGEIIRGVVTLGSLRVRQDFMIAEGLLAPYEQGKPANPEMQRMALARLRQLSAHEVGHTLGLAHNFAASPSDRASVMDYPAALALLSESGVPDLSQAYAIGMGDWDKVTIAYAYQEFAPGADEAAELAAILKKAHERGLTFITDSDSRPAGGAHPSSHLWDNGRNAVDELNRLMQLRAKALGRFCENNIKVGEPYSNLEDTLVPLYLAHRYQVEAASKILGGLNYTYSVRGDGQMVTAFIPGAEQRRALDALLATVQSKELVLPESLLKVMPPRAFQFERTRESFPSRTGLTFDPLSAAETAASLTMGQILHPERAARLEQYHLRDASLPSLSDVIDRVLAATFRAPHLPGMAGEVQRRVDFVTMVHLLSLAMNDTVAPEAAAVTMAKLQDLQQWTASQSKTATDPRQRAHYLYLSQQIRAYLEDPKKALPKLMTAPPGQPI